MAVASKVTKKATTAKKATTKKAAATPKKATATPKRAAAPGKKATATPKQTTTCTKKKSTTPPSLGLETGSPKLATVFLKANCGGFYAEDVEYSHATFSVSVMLGGHAIAKFTAPLPDPKDVHWCTQGGPALSLDVGALGKDGHMWTFQESLGGGGARCG